MAKKTARREARETGPVRTPLGGRRSKLQLSDADLKDFKRRGMVTRWINNEDGRLESALGGGYNYVHPKYAPSLGRSVIGQENTDEGSRVSKIVTRASNEGPAVRGYLMEIKEKFWKEDQATKEERNQLVDDALAVGNAGGAEIENQYGPGVTYSH